MRRILDHSYSFHFSALSYAVIFCSFFVLSMCIVVQPVHADTYSVTNTLDAGMGSLRQATIDASAGDIIVFDSMVFSTPLTITLTSGPILITKSLTIDGAVG